MVWCEQTIIESVKNLYRNWRPDVYLNVFIENKWINRIGPTCNQIPRQMYWRLTHLEHHINTGRRQISKVAEIINFIEEVASGWIVLLLIFCHIILNILQWNIGNTYSTKLCWMYNVTTDTSSSSSLMRKTPRSHEPYFQTTWHFEIVDLVTFNTSIIMFKAYVNSIKLLYSRLNSIICIQVVHNNPMSI